jgi:hypothetical protein
MKLLDLLNSLASKCGKQNEQAVIDILSRADLQNIDLADDVANAINNNLLTVDAAKNNLLVKNHFNALALGSVDTEILNTIKKLELGEDFETEITGLKNTFEKQRKLADKLKESIDNLKASQGKGDTKDIEKYTKQINDLNSKIAQLKESTVPKSELEKVQKESENSVRDFMVHSKIAGLKFANENVGNDVNIAFANVLLNNALSKSKAVIAKEGNDLKLKNADDQNLYFLNEQNKNVSFDDFMNKVFADSKILAVSGQKSPITPTTNPVNPIIPGNQGQQPGTAEFQSAVQQAINELK